MSFAAKYEGTCTMCGEKIERGDVILGSRGAYYHAECPPEIVTDIDGLIGQLLAGT